MRLFLICFSAFFLFLYGNKAVNAIDLGGERVRVSGFGTFGMTAAGDDAHGFRRKLNHSGQFGGLSVLSGSNFGLQIDVDILPNLSATVQAVAEERAKYDFNNIVDWAFLSYQATPSVVARVGRMGIDLFMITEYRNVGFAYLWAHPIVEFYAPIPFSHFNGADLKYSHQIEAGRLDFKVFAGQTYADINAARGDVYMKIQPLVGANVLFESEHWKARLSYAAAELSSVRSPVDQLANAFNQIPPAIWPQSVQLPGELSGEGRLVNYLSAGMAYDNNAWLIQSEVAMTSSEWSNSDKLNGYFSVGRRFGSVTLYSVAAAVKSTDKLIKVSAPLVSSPRLDQLQAVTQNALRASRVDQQTVSLGMRWDLYPQMALKAQWDHTWVDKDGTALLVMREPLEKNMTLNIFSVNLNFVF